MRQHVFRASALCGGVLVALVSAELLFRVFGLSAAPEPMTVDPEMVFHQRDDDVGYTLRPGAEGVFQGVEISVNQQGCRGPELEGDAPLVVGLGDSITFGATIEEPEAFLGRLRASLAEAGEPARVLGCGVSGWNLEQMMDHFDRDLAPLDPTVVVVNLFADDLSPPYLVADRRLSSWLRQQSAAYRTIELSRLWPGGGNRELPGWARDHAEYGAAIEARFAEWLARHRAAGVRFVIVTHPLLGRNADAAPEPQIQLANSARAEGVPVVFMGPIYAEATGGEIVQMSIDPVEKDPHPTSDGHALIAEELRRVFEEFELLGAEVSPPEGAAELPAPR